LGFGSSNAPNFAGELIMPRRVLFGVYPWAFDCPGGGERQLLVYRNHLQQRGHTVGLYDPWQPVGQGWSVFHFFSVMPGSIQLCNYIRNKGIKLVISPNLWVTPATRWNYPHEDIYRLVEISDLLVVNSQLEADAHGEVYNLSPERFHVVYNGVDNSFLAQADAEEFRAWAGLGNCRYLLNVANVEERKNQLAFLSVLDQHPDLKLVVVGHARDTAYLEACLKKGGERFLHVGALEYGSVLLRSAMAGAEAFVMPSALETPSIAALEAAAMGCRLLVTEVGSATEYFGQDAIYVNPASVESMREGLARVLVAETDHLRNRVRSRFMWDGVVTELERAYDRVCMGGL
jgi:glycosyltransferase involved in cell wall biosynthesis